MNHDIGAAQHAFQVVREHRTNVRNHFLDVLAVGTDQAADGDVFVPDLDFTALSQQALDQLYLRAFAQVVRVGLEGQPQERL